MRHSLRLVGLVLGAMAGLGFAGAAYASCEVPLAIGGATAEANVLIILDNSGSMNEALTPDVSIYNPATTYSGKFNKSTTYNINTSKYYTPKQVKNSINDTSPSAYLVTSDGGQSGQYNGNYLNWIYYHATAAQIAAIPVVTRIQSAKSVVGSVLGSVSGVNFGLEIYNPPNGKIVANIGTAVSSIQATVAGLVASTSTPLAGSFNTAKGYFQTTGVGAPITASCQKNFIILVTDGLPNSDISSVPYCTDVDGDGSLLDDIANYMYRNDMRPDLTGLQNVATFTIGYNVDANLLQKTADKGAGAYFSISDGAGLVNALNYDFNVIAARVAGGTAVAVVSSDDRTNNRLYRARYQSQTWRGYVEAFALPYHSGDTPIWEAGSLLSAMNPDNRNVLTSTGGTDTYPFTAANSSTLRSLLAAPNDTTARNIINYVRGRSFSWYRDRGGWTLGDVVDAAPVSIGHPNAFNNFLNYWSFRSSRATRPEMVYVAANDGQLHCFSAATGAEQWAYVPKSTLPQLSALCDPSYCHKYFLNVTPAAYDIYMGGAWKTVVIGGQAQAGNGYFALDVTAPSADSVRVLWDTTVPGMQGAWNPPTLVRDRNRNAQVLAVGTGYNASSAQGQLIVLDPSDGSTMSTFTLGSAVAGNKMTKAVAVDVDFDGYDDRLYLGDLMGNIWRVNLTTSPWTVNRLFSCGKPIQAPPVVTLDAMNRPMLFFGTGEFISTGDLTSTATQTIYAVTDDGSGATVTTSDLVDQTSTINALTTGKKGWSMDLTQASGERITHSGVLINGTLYLTSFVPDPSACTGGGQSWLYSLDWKDGSAPDNAHGMANQVTTGRVKSEGDGILADPSVDLLSSAIILQSSNTALLTENLGSSIKRLTVKSWRQKWN